MSRERIGRQQEYKTQGAVALEYNSIEALGTIQRLQLTSSPPAIQDSFSSPLTRYNYKRFGPLWFFLVCFLFLLFAVAVFKKRKCGASIPFPNSLTHTVRYRNADPSRICEQDSIWYPASQVIFQALWEVPDVTSVPGHIHLPRTPEVLMCSCDFLTVRKASAPGRQPSA